MIKYKYSVVLIYNNSENTVGVWLKDIINAFGVNSEIICVNNGSTDNSLKTVIGFDGEYPNIRLLNLPEKVESDSAKRTGAALASGEFVYFIDADETPGENFCLNLLSSASSDFKVQYKNNYPYRRSFIENNELISEIIDNKLAEKVDLLYSNIEDKYAENDKKIQKFEQVTAENISNSVYNLSVKFEQTEKFIENKNKEYLGLIDNAVENVTQNYRNENKCIFDEISKVYDSVHEVYEYINEQTSKKDAEITRVYDEITKNYSYTENLINEKLSYIDKKIVENIERISENEKCIQGVYEDVKKLINVKIDDFKSRFNETGNFVNNGIEDDSVYKVLSDGIDNVYATVEKSSREFYDEISELYKKLNEKINQQREEELYLMKKEIENLRSELSSDFSEKIENLKKNAGITE